MNFTVKSGERRSAADNAATNRTDWQKPLTNEQYHARMATQEGKLAREYAELWRNGVLNKTLPEYFLAFYDAVRRLTPPEYWEVCPSSVGYYIATLSRVNITSVLTKVDKRELQGICDAHNAAVTQPASATPDKAYRVTGDHPVLARPDKWGLTSDEAESYAKELREDGFDNVAIHEHIYPAASVSEESAQEKCLRCEGYGWYPNGTTDKPEQVQCEACYGTGRDATLRRKEGAE